MKILYLCFIWPEPKSSAAGFRTLQQIVSLKEQNYEIIVASSCQPNQYQQQLEDSGIPTRRFLPNDSEIDLFLKKFQPDVVVFDRFIIEEQFSWRVKQHCSHAIRILDTIDLHSLRRIRQNSAKNNQEVSSFTEQDLICEDLTREIASIYRCDVTLILSDYEKQFLTQVIRIDASLLQLTRFYYPQIKSTPEFKDRKNFVSIGNFNHPPNVDCVKLLHSKIWPNIKKLLLGTEDQNAELHIYGAYPSHEILKLNSPLDGFKVIGWTEDSTETLSNYRVNLAPIRFGAGIKGKVSDGWYAGTPCIATSLAAEGMFEDYSFGGVIEDDFDEFGRAAVDLYYDTDRWRQTQKNGFELINSLYNFDTNRRQFLQCITSCLDNKESIRQKNYIGAILWSSQMRSTEYLSRWIEVKNQLKQLSTTK